LCKTNTKVKSIEKLVAKHTRNKNFDLKSECNHKCIDNIDHYVKYIDSTNVMK